MKGMFDMMKKAQEVQKNLKLAQEKLNASELEGRAAGGKVTVVMGGNFSVKSVKIDPALVDADDVETLQDVLTVAVNDAVNKVRDLTETTMSAATGGLKLPGM
ncbi:MAG: YbaB/EbfC family nucleoid-associated protein [Pseudomonadaceae bacterium]|nr:YbaB/EbfC family nucleoid-associated protein [Pseudomonadaceae bacterium]